MLYRKKTNGHRKQTSQAEARWAPYLTAIRFSEEIHQAAKTTDSLEIKYLESLPQ